MKGLAVHEITLLCVLAAVILAVLWALKQRDQLGSSRIHLDDLLLGDDNKASRPAFVLGGSFIVTSWVVIFETMNKSLSDLTFAAYITAWVVPTVTKLIKGPDAAPDSKP